MRLIFLILSFVAVIQATTLTGTLYHPLGGTATGTLVLSVPAGVTMDRGCGAVPGGVYRIAVTSGVYTSPSIVATSCFLPVRQSYDVVFTKF